MIPDAQICHVSPGRVRIRVSEKRGDEAYFSRVRQQLSTVDGVEDLRTSPVTGSILIEHPELPLESLLQSVHQSRLFQIRAHGAQASESSLRYAETLVRVLDKGFARFTSGVADLRSLLFVLLIALAIRQIIRGNVLVPAFSLAWWAFELLKRPAPPPDGTDPQ